MVGTSIDKIDNEPNLIKHRANITDEAAVSELNQQIGGLENLDYLVTFAGIFGPRPIMTPISISTAAIS